MELNDIHQQFVAELEKRISKKTELANFLSETLYIEKESAYRRLRGDVQFSFQEAALLAKKLDISIDYMIGPNPPEKSRPFYLKLINYVDPQQVDYEMVEAYAIFLRELGKEASAEVGIVTKMIPDIFFLKYNSLTRFYFFKWYYQYWNKDISKSFKEINSTDRMLNILKESFSNFDYVNHIYYIFDKSIFKNLVDDIIYFYDIDLIDNEDLSMLKQELFSLVDRLENYAMRGVNSMENKIDFFISNVNFDTGFTYIDSQICKLCLVRTFTLHDLASLDELTLTKAKVWIQSLKKTSTKISESGEIERKKFFNEQRKIVDAIKQTESPFRTK